MAPLSSLERRQSTLTQMDFGSGRKFGLDAEIADSDEEDEDYIEEREPRPRKRFRIVDGNSIGTPSLLKQSTLTQMDFGRLRQAIPDSDDEDDEELEIGANSPEMQVLAIGAEEKEQAPILPSNQPYQETPKHQSLAGAQDSYVSGFGTHASPRYEPSSIIQSPTFLRMDDRAQQSPQTPRHKRTETIPSSQTPSATPISIPGTEHRKPLQEDPVSPSPAPRIHSPTSLQQHIPPLTIFPTPVQMAPPPLPPARLSPIKDKSLNNETPTSPTSQHDPSQAQPQTQTQTTPRTKTKIRDFNLRWAQLSARPEPPSVPIPPVDHTSFSMSEHTQEMLLAIDMSKVNSDGHGRSDNLPQSVRFDDHDPEIIPAALEWEEESQLMEPQTSTEEIIRQRKKREVIIIASSQDDDVVSSPISEVEEPIRHHTRRGLESIIPLSSPRIQGSLNRDGDRTPRATSNIVVETQRHTMRHRLPASGSVARSSQASTTAGTQPHEPLPASLVVAATSPLREHIDYFKNDDDEEEDTPSLRNNAYLGDESIESTLYPNRVTISQLLPSSLMESVPRPPLDTQEIGDEWEEDDEL